MEQPSEKNILKMRKYAEKFAESLVPICIPMRR